MKNKFSAFLPLICIVIIWACAKEEHQTDFTKCGNITYESDIKELLDEKCNNAACHGAAQLPVMTYYDAVKASVDNGNFEKYVISQKLMPEGDELTNEEYDLINCWLHDGAPKN